MTPELTQISPLLFEFEWISEVSDELLQHQLTFKDRLQKEFTTELVELRMGFKTLALVLSKPLESQVIKQWLKSNSTESPLMPLPSKIWQIPVCYSHETGRDLQTLAKSKNIEQEELISLHSQGEYRLHFYGFLPGFMYLNGLPNRLYTARKSVPDRVVPAGSVAIGASQTGIYPSASPGGWHLIGQTPVPLFDPGHVPPVFASAGERIEFIPITIQQFRRLQRHPHPPLWR